MEEKNTGDDRKAISDPGRKENRLRKFSLIHPFFFACFPVLAFLSENIQEIPFSQSYRSLGLAILSAVLLLFMFRIVIRDWDKAAALASFLLILFFSYGHVYMILKEARIAGVLLGRHRFLLPAFALVFLIGAWFLVKKVKNAATLSKQLVLVSIVLFIFPVYTLVSYYFQSLTNDNDRILENVSLESDLTSALEYQPDIYYIILDAYLRSDILQEVYGYDNSTFLQQLRERGFYVADQATSNYTLTALSLTSSLNMEHLPPTYGDMSKDDYPSALSDHLAHSNVRAVLEQQGYTIIAISSGWKSTEITDADMYLEPQIVEIEELRQSGRINAFESIFIRTTALLSAIDLSVKSENSLINSLEAPFLAHHYFVLSQFDYLERVSTQPGPKFVFAHIISPHSPYVFGPDGELLTSTEAFTWADGVGPREYVDTEIGLYSDQARYISQRAIETIDVILSNSERPPIILLQADHGPGVRLAWNSPSDEGIRDRMSILSAYLYPDSCRDLLYPTITPVNSFATLFQCTFGQPIDLRDDLNYFSPRTDPYQFTDVTSIVQ
jgi:hypothetical protein